MNFSSLCFFPGDATDLATESVVGQNIALFVSQIVVILVREYQKTDIPGNFDALIVRFEPTVMFCGDCPETFGDKMMKYYSF